VQDHRQPSHVLEFGHWSTNNHNWKFTFIILLATNFRFLVSLATFPNLFNWSISCKALINKCSAYLVQTSLHSRPLDFSSLHAFKHGIEEHDFSMFLCFYICISFHCPPLSLSIWYYLWFSRAIVSAVNCLFVLPPPFIILALLSYLANKLIDWLIDKSPRSNSWELL